MPLHKIKLIRKRLIAEKEEEQKPLGKTSAIAVESSSLEKPYPDQNDDKTNTKECKTALASSDNHQNLKPTEESSSPKKTKKINSEEIFIDDSTYLIAGPDFARKRKYLYITQAPAIKNLVFSGGETNNTFYAGVIQALEKRDKNGNLLSESESESEPESESEKHKEIPRPISFRENLVSIAGSSMGAFTAGLFACGCSSLRISQIDFKKKLESESSILGGEREGKKLLKFIRSEIHKSLILALSEYYRPQHLRKEGLDRKEVIEQISQTLSNQRENFKNISSEEWDFIKTIFDELKKYNPCITFAMLKSLRKLAPEKLKDLSVTAVCRENGAVTAFNAENTPDLEIALACRASASLPAVLKPVPISIHKLKPGYSRDFSENKTLTFIGGGYLKNLPIPLEEGQQKIDEDSYGCSSKDLETLVLTEVNNTDKSSLSLSRSASNQTDKNTRTLISYIKNMLEIYHPGRFIVNFFAGRRWHKNNPFTAHAASEYSNDKKDYYSKRTLFSQDSAEDAVSAYFSSHQDEWVKHSFNDPESLVMFMPKEKRKKLFFMQNKPDVFKDMKLYYSKNFGDFLEKFNALPTKSNNNIDYSFLKNEFEKISKISDPAIDKFDCAKIVMISVYFEIRRKSDHGQAVSRGLKIFLEQHLSDLLIKRKKNANKISGVVRYLEDISHQYFKRWQFTSHENKIILDNCDFFGFICDINSIAKTHTLNDIQKLIEAKKALFNLYKNMERLTADSPAPEKPMLQTITEMSISDENKLKLADVKIIKKELKSELEAIKHKLFFSLNLSNAKELFHRNSNFYKNNVKTYPETLYSVYNSVIVFLDDSRYSKYISDFEQKCLLIDQNKSLSDIDKKLKRKAAENTYYGIESVKNISAILTSLKNGLKVIIADNTNLSSQEESKKIQAIETLIVNTYQKIRTSPIQNSHLHQLGNILERMLNSPAVLNLPYKYNITIPSHGWPDQCFIPNLPFIQNNQTSNKTFCKQIGKIIEQNLPLYPLKNGQRLAPHLFNLLYEINNLKPEEKITPENLLKLRLIIYAMKDSGEKSQQKIAKALMPYITQRQLDKDKTQYFSLYLYQKLEMAFIASDNLGDSKKIFAKLNRHFEVIQKKSKPNDIEKLKIDCFKEKLSIIYKMLPQKRSFKQRLFCEENSLKKMLKTFLQKELGFDKTDIKKMKLENQKEAVQRRV